MDYRVFENYRIYENGTILNQYNKELSPRVKEGRMEIRLIHNGKRCNFILSRLVFWLFSTDFNIEDKNLCVIAKDGDLTNVHIDNLEVIHRKDLIQGEAHKNTSKLSDKDVENIRTEYASNIASYQTLANKYNVSKGNIALIIRGESRNKQNYKLA